MLVSYKKETLFMLKWAIFLLSYFLPLQLFLTATSTLSPPTLNNRLWQFINMDSKTLSTLTRTAYVQIQKTWLLIRIYVNVLHRGTNLTNPVLTVGYRGKQFILRFSCPCLQSPITRPQVNCCCFCLSFAGGKWIVRKEILTVKAADERFHWIS